MNIDNSRTIKTVEPSIHNQSYNKPKATIISVRDTEEKDQKQEAQIIELVPNSSEQKEVAKKVDEMIAVEPPIVDPKTDLPDPQHPIPETPPFQHSEPIPQEPKVKLEVSKTPAKKTSIIDELMTKENNILSESEVRTKKAHLLHLYEKKNVDSKYYPAKFDMTNNIDEIESALTYVLTKKNSENSLGFWRHGLGMLVEGVAWTNSTLDPFGVDLTMWAKNVQADIVQRGNYDEIIEEILQKYSSSGSPMPVEARLAMALGGSLVMSIIAQKKDKKILEDMLAAEMKPSEADRLRDEMIQKDRIAREIERAAQRKLDEERYANMEREREKERETFMQQLKELQNQIAQLQTPKSENPNIPMVRRNKPPVYQATPQIHLDDTTKQNSQVIADGSLKTIDREDDVDEDVPVSNSIKNRSIQDIENSNAMGSSRVRRPSTSSLSSRLSRKGAIKYQGTLEKVDL
ncbi:hypothetical protein M427DRAFT_50138 [Gonapodya prolifera JEL478]|uniref:Uncharacterized protein n=1 Tax=Gonapodya prolifera (strain JEL478) TaxID=1344416 RepID=A0A138ZXW0_GONPJ|nr:hypothetical protein M427DRAFT_50138 [Gonapodya prolifera JEL478]|eukprot:KXS08973.1 hypothetical protein M427DRAFT_50138 [Gonapodya prolifera JEL478]